MLFLFFEYLMQPSLTQTEGSSYLHVHLNIVLSGVGGLGCSLKIYISRLRYFELCFTPK